MKANKWKIVGRANGLTFWRTLWSLSIGKGKAERIIYQCTLDVDGEPVPPTNNAGYFNLNNLCQMKNINPNSLA